MGCDIHMYAETRPTTGDPWTVVGEYFTNDYHPRYDGRALVAEVYTTRSYAMFTQLAGVRDYDGEVDRLLGDPRGIPVDSPWRTVDATYGAWFGAHYLGDHSFSHCTLAELKAHRDEWVDDRFRRAIDELEALRGIGMTGADVRVVFGFDS